MIGERERGGYRVSVSLAKPMQSFYEVSVPDGISAGGHFQVDAGGQVTLLPESEQHAGVLKPPKGIESNREFPI